MRREAELLFRELRTLTLAIHWCPTFYSIKKRSMFHNQEINNGSNMTWANGYSVCQYLFAAFSFKTRHTDCIHVYISVSCWNM